MSDTYVETDSSSVFLGAFFLRDCELLQFVPAQLVLFIVGEFFCFITFWKTELRMKKNSTLRALP
jgi:hypothetical protein